MDEDVKDPSVTEKLAGNLTRRSFLGRGGATVGALTGSLPSVYLAAPGADGPFRSKEQVIEPRRSSAASSSFIDLLELPDSITAYEGFQKTRPDGAVRLAREGEQWVGGAVMVETKREREVLSFTLTSPTKPIALVHAYWKRDVPTTLTILGDAWERSYGELGWRTLIPERVLPWYFATWDGAVCDGYGVRTDARALCFWQIDQHGVSLWLNVTNGGNGVLLGERRLEMASVVSRRGGEGVDAMESVAALCKVLCARRSRSVRPIYGVNDWCYAYGRSTGESILRDTDFIVELSPTGGPRPFSVIDGGWSNGTTAWPDMGKLSAAIKRSTARPGIWMRPLEAPKNTARSLLLPDARFGARTERAQELAYDLTIPETSAKIRGKIHEITDWGYEMVKHDFSTYDLLGQWGFEMGPQPTLPGWSLHDRSVTNAEVITKLYRLIREEVGDKMVVNGCNTIGHLGQGWFDLQRTGDDTSGRQWERTRRMGVNTLAFRLPQHGSFFTLDADLVGITDAVPWELNRQWLDVLARSGTVTMVSPGPPARGAEQRAALRDACQLAAAGGVAVKPVDWMQTSAPEHWQGVRTKQQFHYDWSGLDGASPFLSA